MRYASEFSNDAAIALAILGPRTVSEPDDADLLALALGVADDETREACARALLGGERTAHRLQEDMAHPIANEALALPPKDRKRRVVEAFLGEAERAARLLAEGLQEGETILAASLIGMRVGWRLASEASDHDAVARFAEALMAELMERGAWEELAELADLGYRAADALDLPRLRSRLLAYEGAAWSRRGDYERAAQLWTKRVALNRRIENPVGEADALMDLAGDSLERGDLDSWADWIAQAEEAVGRSGRSILAARFWMQHAHERLRAGDLDFAVRHADRAVGEIADVSLIDVELGVRKVAARILGSCGQTNRAIKDLSVILSLAIDGGRPAHAAVVIESVGDLLLAQGDERLASRCLRSALAIYRALGTRRARELAERLEEDPLDRNREGPAWDALAREVLTAIEGLELETSIF